MNKRLFSRAGLGLIALAFIALTMIASVVFKSWRLDLTENGLFTVSDGTRNILKNLDEPIHLYFFFSDNNSKDLPSLRTYAQRVRELLQEYERLAGGKLILQTIDPAPFSEDEDKAAQYGLQAVPVAANTEIYFGLAGTNSVDDKETIRFFQPDKEEQLEYEISKLIAKLNQKKAPVVGLLSGLPIKGGMDFMTQQPQPAWTVIEQLKQMFELRDFTADVDAIPDDISLLVLVQPKGLSERARYAIDQYVLRGGKLMVFADPFAESDRTPAGQGNPFPQTMQGDDLNALFAPWGFKIDMNQVVLDAEYALSVGGGMGRAPMRHLGLLGLSGKIDGAQTDTVAGGLENVNLGVVGAVQALDGATTILTPLLRSSSKAALVSRDKFEFLPDPSALAQGFAASGEVYTIAARVSGKVKSGFAAAPAGAVGDFLAQSKGDIHVMVVADTDLLSDRYWVQVQDFFGQRMAQAFADNGNFVANAVETYAGSSDLIGLRSRGRFARPFVRVAELKQGAEVAFRAREDELQKRLDETEKQLADLQKRMNSQGEVQLNAQEESTLKNFQEEKIRIRKELRDVQHQLNRDIEALGDKLKLINIALMPLLLIFLASALALASKNARKGARRAVNKARAI